MVNRRCTDCLQVKIRCWSCGVKKQGKCGELFAGKLASAALAAAQAAQAAQMVRHTDTNSCRTRVTAVTALVKLPPASRTSLTNLVFLMWCLPVRWSPDSEMDLALLYCRRNRVPVPRQHWTQRAMSLSGRQLQPAKNPCLTASLQMGWARGRIRSSHVLGTSFCRCCCHPRTGSRMPATSSHQLRYAPLSNASA